MNIAKTRRYFVIAAILFASTVLLAQQTKVKINAVESAALSANPGPGAGEQLGGRLEIVGAKGSDAVYLNGKGPDFFVGYVKDTRNHKLVLPPGQQHVILVDPQGDKQVYSAYVEIKSGQKATLHVDKSDISYEKWSGEPGMQFMAVGKTGASPGSENVAYNGVAPVTGTFTAPTLVNCGQRAPLNWTTNGQYTVVKVHNQVAYGGLPSSGQLLVDPGEGTTYVLESFSPGGVYISPPQTVGINKEVHTTLTASPRRARYHRVGDRVIEDPMITLDWTADNADSVRIDPIGPVTGTSGRQLVKFTSSKNEYAPGEFISQPYTITASNTCGGTATSTASVQWDPVIDPEIVVQALPPVLPKTASPLPLIALLGFGSLISGFVLRMIRKG